jgi:hypothetical protein
LQIFIFTKKCKNCFESLHKWIKKNIAKTFAEGPSLQIFADVQQTWKKLNELSVYIESAEKMQKMLCTDVIAYAKGASARVLTGTKKSILLV